MPVSKHEGTLRALVHTPPFQKLLKVIDGAPDNMLYYYHRYFRDHISDELWGKNRERLSAYTKRKGKK